MLARELPLPPYDMASRVGSLDNASDPWTFYDWLGSTGKTHLERALPPEYDLTGRRVLDFGCGAGRVLRHFVADERSIELWGCDIDAPSIAWLQENLSPPVHPFVNPERPPLDVASDFFDVIYCVSVFTHLTDTWSAWLAELHRVLKPGGLLIATFMGEGQSELIAGEPWREDDVGMLVLRPGQSWDRGGPMVLHSPWWIREHWGRIFDVLTLEPHGFAAEPGRGHGVVTLSKRPGAAEIAALEALGEDPREARALAHNVAMLCAELEQLRPTVDWLENQLRDERATREAAAAAHARSDGIVRDLTSSPSWRLTKPLRLAKHWARGRIEPR